MCDQEDDIIGQFCIQRDNYGEYDKIESLANLIEVAGNVTRQSNCQADLFFNRRKTSGDYPNDYLAEKSLKPFHIDSIKEFNGPQALSLQYSSLPHGYLSEIDRCWFYHEDSITFWETSNPKNTFICYPFENKINNIFIFPISHVFTNRLAFLTVFVSKISTIFCLSFLQFDEKTKDFNDFFVDIRNSVILPSTESEYTCYSRIGSDRILLGCNDGNIYEISYSIDDDKLVSCEAFDISTPKIMCLIPSIVYKMREVVSIVDIQVEMSNNILFALDSKFNINIYKINQFNEKLSRLETIYFSNINIQASELLKKSNYFIKHRIIKISAVLPTESRYIQLIVLFDNGYRVFLSNISEMNSHQINTTRVQFKVVHVRKPPFDDVSAIKSIYSSYVTLDTTIICTDYNKSFRLWCLTRSLRCSHDTYQESLTVYAIQSPVKYIKSRPNKNLHDSTPYLISSCYNPKNRIWVQLQEYQPNLSFISMMSELQILPINYKKSYEILLSIYRLRDYFNTDEFISYTSRSTDIEFNISCYSILGKLTKTDTNLINTILEDLWESSFQYEVDFIKMGIYKHLISSDKDASSQYIALHCDLANLKIPEAFQLKTKRVSFILYTLLLHAYPLLMCVWESRIFFQSSDNKVFVLLHQWEVSLNCLSTKHIRALVESLLLCVHRVSVFYKAKLNDSSFLRFDTYSSDKSLNFNEDIRLLQHLEWMISLTQEFLYIWTGITAVNFMNFFSTYDLIEQLTTFTYYELIFKQPDVLDDVIWKFLAFTKDQPSVFEFLTNNWPNDASKLFPSSFREIALANNKLMDCLMHPQIGDLRNKSLEFCLNTYMNNPINLDLTWICNCLNKINLHPNAVSLCLKVYDSLLTARTSLTLSTNKNHLNFMINKTQEILFHVLNDSYRKQKSSKDSRIWKNPCIHGVEFHIKNMKESLNVALNGVQDERLAHQIFDWIIKNDFTQYLLGFNSPHLHSYLDDVDFNDLSLHDLRKARCQYEIYENRKNFLLSALQLFKIASAQLNFVVSNNEASLSINDRSDYLHIALAQVSLSPNTPEVTSIVQAIKEKLQVIELQRKVCEELETELNRDLSKKNPNMSPEVLKLHQAHYKLKNCLMSCKTILDEIVLPCQLTTSYLLIIRRLGSDFVDLSHLNKIWNYLFQQVIDIMTNTKAVKKEKALAQFKLLLTEYGPIQHCFPFNNLLSDFETRLGNTNLGHRWLPDILVETGIKSYDQYARCIQDILCSRFVEFSDNKSLLISTTYMFETYCCIVQHILKDITKSSFIESVKSFKDFIEMKLPSLDVSSSTIKHLKTMIYSLREIMVDSYQNQMSITQP